MLDTGTHSEDTAIGMNAHIATPSAIQNEQVQSDDCSILRLDCLMPFALGNTRKARNPAKYAELKSSIRQRGVIQSIVVRPHPEMHGMFEVIAGNGRYEASLELELETIPALIKHLSDAEAIEVQLIENSNREDLSLIDEADAAQRWLGFYEGDRQAAADRLGWGIRKLSERLELLRCSDPVQQALTNGEIKPAHAIILAPFSEKLQNGTLAKIIAEKWTVSQLKQKASTRQHYLVKAKFDTAQCSGCHSNTEAQAGLFEQDNHAKCSNPQCWGQKTQAWLDEQRALAEDKYGKVLWLNEIAVSDRNPVSASEVGQEQFQTGCTGCTSNVALMDNTDGREGIIVANQCLDKGCFAKCVKAQQSGSEPDAPTSAMTPSTDSASTSTTKSSSSAATQPVVTKKVAKKVNRKVQEIHRGALRDAAVGVLTTDVGFNQGVVLGLLCIKSGYKPPFKGWPTNAHGSDLFKLVQLTMAQEPTQVQAQIKDAIKHLAVESENKDRSGASGTVNHLMLNSLSALNNWQETAVAAWTPTKELFSAHTIGELTTIATESGFVAAYNTANGERAFTKLAGKGKGGLVKVMLEFEFDWSAYAPSTGYFDLVSPPVK
ncbi:PRTRC system ParB family protein [Neiella sp. HB171785]|uniref:PRTRC system ParB family protein n=2 Tax=Neiella litorisoli TaxID=2771431 RepID=A0A8J6QIP3_9GAMM|nr:PRTRC system ParB family protein [Neiella litorisoli]